MADIKAITGKSPQSLYRLLRENAELSALLDSHTSLNGHNRFFDTTIVEWFKNYYKIDRSNEKAVPATFSEELNEAIPQDSPPDIEELNGRIAALEEQLQLKDKQVSEQINQANSLIAQLEEARKQITALEGQQTKKEEQIEELIRQSAEAQKQNSQLLLLLQEEKQEKQKLLPAPKESIIKKIGQLFKKRNT